MNLIKTEYRIDIWKDEWNGSSWDEIKVATIGTHDMEFLGRAYQPILNRTVSGDITFSFNMYANYFNPETGKKENNYLIPYLFNEVKIKLYCPQYDDGINNGWFDFIIKDIKENRGKEISFSYSCQYLPINELAKTGQNLVFSMDLDNSTGKINELAQAVLAGTEWTIGSVSANLTESVEETLFSITTTSLLNLTGISTVIGTPDDITNLPIGSILYIPYSEITNVESSTIQVLYIEGTTDNLTFKNGNVITNTLCNYSIPRNTWGTPTYTSTEYRGARIVLTYQTEWNKDVEKYVTVYSKSGSSTVYYGYKTTEVISDDPLQELVVGEVQHYFYYSGSTVVEADSETGLTPVIIANSEKYRTLEADKSNRFNLIQSIAELFEVWARFDVAHDSTGKIISKTISFVDVIGGNNWAGFTYGVNLNEITRNIVSSELATKMIVTPIENDNLSNGACSIGYSNANVSGEEFLINLDYYAQVGLIPNREELIYDLYTVGGSTGIGYLTNLGILNDQYNSYNDLDISLATYVAIYEERVAAKQDAITAAQEVVDNLVEDYNGGICSSDAALRYNTSYTGALQTLTNNQNELIILQNQLNLYKQQKADSDSAQAAILAQKVTLHNTFNSKYSRFIQEGIWEGGKTYTNDDAYYYDAQNVILESSRPNIEYTIKVVDLSILSGYEDFNYKLGDVTYIEDVEYFGYTKPDLHGYSRPYREEVIIAEIESNLDNPKDNKITVRNYKNQFDELFQRVTATVQSYSLNEDVYARANNFTATGEVTFDALQAALINNSLIISKSKTEDVLINKTGITLTDQEDTNKMVKIVSGGIFVSNDAGTSWNTGITGEGINTKLLLAGQIDAAKINIVSGSYPCFSWDSTGLYAYKYAGIPGALTMDTNSFVRFNQDGIYGQKSGTKMFSLDWDGLYLKTGAGLYDIQLGLHTVGATQYLFSAINNSTNTRTFSIDANGNAYFKGNIEATSGTLNSITANNFTLNTGTISGNVSFYGDISGATGLGELAYHDAVEKAMLGTTIIEGGYLKTGLVDASRIDTGTLNANQVNIEAKDDNNNTIIRIGKIVPAEGSNPARYGIRITGENGELMIDEYGIDPRFIKAFKNIIWNSSFERFDPVTKIPQYWSGGEATASSSYDNTYSMKLDVGQMSEQTAVGDCNPRPDPSWWDNKKTRISFFKKGGDVQVQVFSEWDFSPYELTREDGTVASYYNTGYSSNWDDGRYTFSFEPTKPGRIWIRFLNIGSEAAYIDALQMEPDFNGKYPSFYTNGPYSVSADEIPLSNTWLEYINVPYTQSVSVKFNQKYSLPPTVTASLLRNINASNNGGAFGNYNISPNIDLIIEEQEGYLFYTGAFITFGGSAPSSISNGYVSIQVVGRV